MIARGWTVAIAGSVAAHALTFAALALSLKPDQVPDQPLPRTRFSIEAQQVKRTTATPASKAGEPAAESAATALDARQGKVPETFARAVSATSMHLTASAPRASVSVPQTQVAQQVSALPAPPAKAAIAPPKLHLAAVPTPTPVAQSAKVPDSPRIATAVVGTPRTPALRPAQDTAVQATLEALSAADLPLPAKTGKAQLAWSGGGDTTVSATSLAAIAAFTEEGDLAKASRQVRDGIEDILAAVPCARLQTTFIPETGALELRGHIPEDALRGPVLAALRAQVGEAIPLSDQLLILPRPQCGALSGIADVGLPQSTEQLTNPRVIGADGFAQNYTYLDGQRLSLDLVAPDYDSFVYVDYFAADGSVIHLQPNDIVPLEFASAKSLLSVGRVRADGPSLKLTVGAPFGQEIAAAFAASVPLYDGLRPVQEPAAPYLTFLKQQVARARAEHPDFKGEWVYFFISTQAQ